MTLGVTVGMQFHVYGVKNPKSPPLGTVTVRDVKQISSTVERDAPFTIPTPAYASRNERLVGDRLKVHFEEPKDDQERDFIQNLLVKIAKTCDIVTGDNTTAELSVAFEDGENEIPREQRDFAAPNFARGPKGHGSQNKPLPASAQNNTL